MTIFDWINQITLKKGKWDSFSETDQKKFQTYIINRFLSMNMYWIDIVNDLQKYTMGLPLKTKDVYKLYCDLIPKKKTFLRYVKGKKDVKYADWVIDIVCKEYEISKFEAKDYLDIFYLNKDGKLNLKSIIEKYGIEPKLIKKLKLEK